MSFPAELTPGVPFLGARQDPKGTRLVLFGCPYDGTCSFRPGTRFGPPAARLVSDAIETYCPILKRDLSDVEFADVGDLIMPPGDASAALDMAYRMSRSIIAAGQIPAAIGGEHLISLPLIKAVAETHPDLCVVQFDAHYDLRNNYLGVELSHATVMRRVGEFIKPSHILHVGQRSGTREEFERVELLGNGRSVSVNPIELAEWVGNRPLYVTVDMDVLDPSVFPGTGTPEPGGVAFNTLQSWLIAMQNCNWVGWDVVELCPQADPTQVSSIASAKIIRTMILASLNN